MTLDYDQDLLCRGENKVVYNRHHPWCKFQGFIATFAVVWVRYEPPYTHLSVAGPTELRVSVDCDVGFHHGFPALHLSLHYEEEAHGKVLQALYTRRMVDPFHMHDPHRYVRNCASRSE